MNTNQTQGMTAGVLISSNGQFTGMVAGSLTISFGTAPTNLDIRNNIIVNSQTGNYTRYAIYSAAGSANFSNINYNNYFSAQNIGFLGAEQTTLANWQAATGQDANSINVAPVFVSATDLHLVPASNLAINDLGTPIAAVTSDIDGDLRSLTAPDMGADEFSSFDYDAGVIDASSAFCEGVNDVQVTLKNFGLFTLTSATINWSINAVPQTPFAWTGSLVSGATTTVTVGSFSFAAGTTYSLVASSNNPNNTTDENPLNDTYSSQTFGTGLVGLYSVGSGGDFPTLTAA